MCNHRLTDLFKLVLRLLQQVRLARQLLSKHRLVRCLLLLLQLLQCPIELALQLASSHLVTVGSLKQIEKVVAFAHVGVDVSLFGKRLIAEAAFDLGLVVGVTGVGSVQLHLGLVFEVALAVGAF